MQVAEMTTFVYNVITWKIVTMGESSYGYTEIASVILHIETWLLNPQLLRYKQGMRRRR